MTDRSSCKQRPSDDLHGERLPYRSIAKCARNPERMIDSDVIATSCDPLGFLKETSITNTRLAWTEVLCCAVWHRTVSPRRSFPTVFRPQKGWLFRFVFLVSNHEFLLICSVSRTYYRTCCLVFNNRRCTFQRQTAGLLKLSKFVWSSEEMNGPG